jgi:hypothetical protein
MTKTTTEEHDDLGRWWDAVSSNKGASSGDNTRGEAKSQQRG